MQPLNVLFLCTGNSARSIMAEVLLNQKGGGRFRAFSAGSHPKGQVHPLAIETLQRMNLPAEGLRSKSWNEFAGPNAPKLDFVFTVCGNAAKETCPTWPGQPLTAHWGVNDPAGDARGAAASVPSSADRARCSHQALLASALRVAQPDVAAEQDPRDRGDEVSEAPAAAPCTAMVFAWSYLSDGDPASSTSRHVLSGRRGAVWFEVPDQARRSRPSSACRSRFR